MVRLSSRTTFFYKRIFPIIWFGGLLLFLAAALVYTLPSGQSPRLPFLIIPVLMMAFGYFIMKKLVFDLVDKVMDDGDALVIINSDREERVALADITNVSYSPFVNPARVTLSLRRPTIFGDQVTFSAPVQVVPFSSSPRIEALIKRVDAARRR